MLHLRNQCYCETLEELDRELQVKGIAHTFSAGLLTAAGFEPSSEQNVWCRVRDRRAKQVENRAHRKYEIQRAILQTPEDDLVTSDDAA
jgi:hypothetical protein